ncbi:hypothetical protein Kpol_526p18 [Vanderwaltozyma polyspora DSM 70294]|uniref:alcohol dehydrogenase (NADP(+)) n=1 Tax=Vanderwaltozyma polyspora (strain ATCC 22028 / DSM 70294 / BCRC 21397 / CBS 2163 / NBRC 10782 / NRRL Y-8283 / UCD 57-17) TaxID=436907 RepID=A7TLS3_VANPO|nr:uncharacterized protein Kpol_526p18 [Vanderwaltozyma polyspora DSM 70294]EDO16765.1 hypothetical protein Kpol_526p18 [Vanderwaltozyma polyspora DSM 70294]
MSYPEYFQGIGVVDKDNWTHPKHVSYAAKEFKECDVDIEIEACGVCGSDIHCASGDWGERRDKLVVGHEVIGRVIKLGPECHTGLKIGDRVGVGAQVASCLDCERCEHDNEPYCPKFVTTYNQAYPDGYISQGGYASHIRVHEHFVIPVPEKIPTHLAAPLLCGGITVYSPLVRGGCAPGKKVGIVGIGGIGHMGILFAKAMGAEVYAFSRHENKREDSMKLGADHYIATLEEEGWTEKYFNSLDVMILCASSLSQINLDDLIKVMKVEGKIISICVPENDEMMIVKPLGLLGVYVSNSLLGSRKELLELLHMVAEKDIKIWVEKLPVGEAGVSEAFIRMKKGDVRYRFTLTDFDKEFPKN